MDGTSYSNKRHLHLFPNMWLSLHGRTEAERQAASVFGYQTGKERNRRYSLIYSQVVQSVPLLGWIEPVARYGQEDHE